MAIKAKHRANLTKLANYLETLPEGYEHFEVLLDSHRLVKERV